MKTTLTFLAALAAPALVVAQTATLAPQGERIDDATIQGDQRAYESVQGRIKALNDGGRRVADYHLSKAQCWLDASFHEYTRNDRSAFPQAALSESEKLVGAMESRGTPLGFETPLVNGAARLRPDLWDRAQALRSAAGFACAAQKTACAEIELVHAGNEFNQQGWRHAKPYLQIAEDALADAEAQAVACRPAPAGVAALPAAPPPPLPPPLLPPVAAPVPGQPAVAVFFAFDRSGRADIRDGDLARLDALLFELRRDAAQVVSVRLVGHADRRNRTGDRSYNQRLSERRAETLRGALVERGVPSALIAVQAVGDSAPSSICPRTDGHARGEAGDPCFAANRRVDVVFVTARPR